MLRTVILSVMALVAAACAAPPADPPQATAGQGVFVGIDGRPLVSADGVLDNSVQQALTADPAACAKAGGQIGPVCRMQSPMCLITFSDAGKTCSDGADCGSGRCMAETPVASSGNPAKGVCATTNNPCGCYQRIENGIAQPMLCAD